MDLFLSGDNNFRKKIYPEYKANRRKMVRPPSLDYIKDWFKQEYTVLIQDDVEADDLLGLGQTETTCIVSIDKDMLMIPGWHYNYVKNELTHVNYFDGLRHFYTQILIGDPADNIKGAKGIGIAKAEKILRDCETEEDLFNATYPYFSCWEEYDMTAKLLWIQRKGRLNWNDTGIGEIERQEAATNCSGFNPEDVSES